MHRGPTRVNHLCAVLDSNLDNLITSEIGSDWGVLASFSNDIGFVSLWNTSQRSENLVC